MARTVILPASNGVNAEMLLALDMGVQRFKLCDMTKDEAAKIFGGFHADLARALGLTRGAISQWPDTLTSEQTDRVMGAAIRLNKAVPKELKMAARASA